MNTNITVSILAGGEINNFDQSGSLFKIGGKSHIEMLTGRILNFFENVTVVTNDDLNLQWEKVKVVKDHFPGVGQIAGVHAALENSATEKNIILCISQPFISSEFLKFLAEYEPTENITVMSEYGKIQPFPGIYLKKNLNILQTILETNEHIPGTSELVLMKNFVTAMDAEIIEIGYKPFYHSKLLMNFKMDEVFEGLKSITIN